VDSITVNRKDSAINIRLDCVVGHYLSFSFTAYNEFYAKLVEAEVNRCVSDLARSIRREAYEQGWKHAKAKVRKETWFSPRFAR
jgi:hypothetical protein